MEVDPDFVSEINIPSTSQQDGNDEIRTEFPFLQDDNGGIKTVPPPQQVRPRPQSLIHLER